MNSKSRPSHTVEIGYDELCGALAAVNLRPLWKLPKETLPAAPQPATRTWLWKWHEILPLAQRAGDVVRLDRGGDRRALLLANPGLGGMPFTTTTLQGAVQYLAAGDVVPAHRHTPAAIRFVMAGAGAYTTVDGDACDMQRGDLILTANWKWHDHTNESDEPVVWFDGLDLPLVARLESVIFEDHADGRQPVAGRNLSEHAFVAPGLRERTTSRGPDGPSLARYPWADTDRALEALHQLRGGPTVSVEYVDPLTGGPLAPTFACELHRIYPGGCTPTRRKTGSSIYVAHRGRGRTRVAGDEITWEQGDIFVTPSWAPVDHEAHEVADLFVMTDRPVLESLGLYREEALA